jgi:hypothetical protein
MSQGKRAASWNSAKRAEMFDLPLHVFLLQFVSGLMIANGIPHFVQGISGHWFQSPFATPRGIGES